MKLEKRNCIICKKETVHEVQLVRGIITKEEIKRTCKECKTVSRQPLIRL